MHAYVYGACHTFIEDTSNTSMLILIILHVTFHSYVAILHAACNACMAYQLLYVDACWAIASYLYNPHGCLWLIIYNAD